MISDAQAKRLEKRAYRRRLLIDEQKPEWEKEADAALRIVRSMQKSEDRDRLEAAVLSLKRHCRVGERLFADFEVGGAA